MNSSYSSSDASMILAGASIFVPIIIYGIIFLVAIIAQIVISIPYFKMAKNLGISYAWVAFIPGGNFYIATILPQHEMNIFNKFIWPNRAKAFWVFVLATVIYCVLIFPMSFIAIIPVLGWLLFFAYIAAYVAIAYIILWKVNYDILMAYDMEQHAMWASIVNCFCPLVMVVFSFIIMNRQQNSANNY